MYLAREQVALSLRRLASRKSSTEKKSKTHKERTSILMYFLAFDAVCKAKNCSLLDLNPKKITGQENRKSLELEFAKLVLIKDTLGCKVQVLELGKIEESDKSPETRMSSNFLTVPLKKASEQSTPFHYPRRPNAPVIRMGSAATGHKWGIDYHPEWKTNIGTLLHEVKESTPFTDLAVFTQRDSQFSTNDFTEAISTAIKKRYTRALADLWLKKIKQEQIFAKHISASPLTKKYQHLYQPKASLGENNYASMTKDDLMILVSRYKTLLEINNITHTS